MLFSREVQMPFEYPISPFMTSLNPYVPNEDLEHFAARLGLAVDEVAKMDANENPYGPAPLACAAITRQAAWQVYPDPEYRRLTSALAQFTGAPAEQILVGAGSSELMGLTIQALVPPGEGILVCPPTFSMPAFNARLGGGKAYEVPRQPGAALDLNALRQAVSDYHPRLIYLAAPDNPDGRLPTPQEIDALLSLNTMVLLDEAYVEFTGRGFLGCDASRIAEVGQRSNLIVLRTFSKWAGLAGLRVGFGAFPAWLTPTLRSAKQPFTVNRIAQAAAEATLQDLEQVEQRVRLITAERDRLFSAIKNIPGLAPLPSQGNFIFCRVDAQRFGRNAAQVVMDLAARGVLVRGFGGSLQSWMRITAMRPQDSERLLAGLQA
jgi:histidinol-phosphate aminotransferase